MILKKKIPKEFYKLFRTKNRDAYMQFLVAIYEENNEGTWIDDRGMPCDYCRYNCKGKDYLGG